jgi:hypothetical protein
MTSWMSCRAKAGLTPRAADSRSAQSQRLAAIGVTTYRTDQAGTITAATDGALWTVALQHHADVFFVYLPVVWGTATVQRGE